MIQCITISISTRIMKNQRITAVIYDRKGNVLSIGQNSYIKTHPLQARHAERVGMPEKQFLHAEISAITRCRRLDRAHKILVTRYNKHGEPVLAKPCPVCTSAIRAANIQYIEHT
jgi:tRNA(Arg) A34 adenosine deaminase TadA